MYNGIRRALDSLRKYVKYTYRHIRVCRHTRIRADAPPALCAHVWFACAGDAQVKMSAHTARPPATTRSPTRLRAARTHCCARASTRAHTSAHEPGYLQAFSACRRSARAARTSAPAPAASPARDAARSAGRNTRTRSTRLNADIRRYTQMHTRTHAYARASRCVSRRRWGAVAARARARIPAARAPRT